MFRCVDLITAHERNIQIHEQILSFGAPLSHTHAKHTHAQPRLRMSSSSHFISNDAAVFSPTIWRRQLNARARLSGTDSVFFFGGGKENTYYRLCLLSASDLYINMHVNKLPPSILCHMPATTAVGAVAFCLHSVCVRVCVHAHEDVLVSS